MNSANQNPKVPSKPLIFLKSSVIALGIVLVVLIFVLIVIKQKKSPPKNVDCQKFLQLKIAGEVDKMELQGNNIIILTKPNLATKKQEIIKIDSNCSSIISRIEFNQ